MPRAKPNRPPVPKEAIEYFAAKGIKPGFNYTDVWREEHNAAFTAAKLMELDILQAVRDITERAIVEGTTFEKFKKDVGPLLDRSGWSNYHKETPKVSRIRLIYDTNMRVARAAGQWQRIERTKDALPYLEFGPTSSLHPRETHEVYVGLVLPVDDPFWDGCMPPLDYRCKHTVTQLTASEVDRAGGPSDAPDYPEVEWRLPNGVVETAPYGVHPAFNYNPGKERTKGLDDALARAEERTK